MISRIIVYTSLICMVLLTAYQYHNRKMAGRHSREAAARNISATPPGRPAPAPDSHNRHPDAPQEVFPPDVAYPAPGVPPAASRKADKQKEMKDKAIGLFRKKDYDGALRLLGKVETPDTEVLLCTGLCYFKLSHYQSSVSFLRKVLERDKDNFIALKIIAFAYYRLENIDESFDSAGKGLALRSDAELLALYNRLGRERKARQGYTEEDSSHFRVLYNGYKEGTIDREILGILEDAYRTIGQDLDYFPPESVTVILYTDHDFYDTTLAPHWSGGLYDGRIRLPIRGIDLQRPVVRKVLFHEYTHVLVHYIAHSCPLWINEGLAECFSTRYAQKTAQSIPLRDMEKSFAGFSDRDVALAYRESYSAVSYLIEKYGLYRVKAVLEGFGAGKGADAAFEGALGITYTQFISGWGKDGNYSF